MLQGIFWITADNIFRQKNVRHGVIFPALLSTKILSDKVLMTFFVTWDLFNLSSNKINYHNSEQDIKSEKKSVRETDQ